MERRRSWAAAGRLPPKLACRFTLAEQAVLAVVAAEVARHGACTLTIGHIGALAGVSKQTVRNALHEAVRLGLVRVEERRLSAWRNAPNRVTITSPEWTAWLRLRRRGVGQNWLSPRIQVLIRKRQRSGKGLELPRGRLGLRARQTERPSHRSGGLDAGEPGAVLRSARELSYLALCGGRI